jgi:hypothetical protein
VTRDLATQSDLPPWEPRKNRSRADQERNHRWMTRWVNEELDRMTWEETRKDLAGENALTPLEYKSWAIERAKDGNIYPLRDIYPDLAPFLHPPKLKRGQRFPKYVGYDPLQAAAKDVKRIRALWQKHYGKKNRPRDDPLTAEGIAAARHEIGVDALVSKMKKSPRK